jgi:ubiquinone/menaquinone biosynthesis C-methylase UbiE
MSRNVGVTVEPPLENAPPKRWRYVYALYDFLRPQRLPQPAFSRAKEYADLYSGGDPNSQFFNRRLTEINHLLSVIEGGCLLDVGCGPGILLGQLFRRGFALFGLDRSREMIIEAARTSSSQPGLTVGEVEHLPYRDGCFDVVLALGVLEYVTDLDSSFAEIARVLKPGGTVVVSMLNRESWYWLWFRYAYQSAKYAKSVANGRAHLSAMPILYEREQLEEVMKRAGLEPTRLSYYNVNVCIEPISSRYPRMACWINGRLEKFGRTVFSRLINTGFLISATRRSAGSEKIFLAAPSCAVPVGLTAAR